VHFVSAHGKILKAGLCSSNYIHSTAKLTRHHIKLTNTPLQIKIIALISSLAVPLSHLAINALAARRCRIPSHLRPRRVGCSTRARRRGTLAVAAHHAWPPPTQAATSPARAARRCPRRRRASRSGAWAPPTHARLAASATGSGSDRLLYMAPSPNPSWAKLNF
jgi:hypothetical protein